MKKMILDAKTIRSATRLLNADLTLTAVGVTGGFLLQAQGKNLEAAILERQRGGERLFKNLNALARFVRGLGLGSFVVDMRGWDERGRRLL